MGESVADTMRPMLDALLGGPPVRFEFWDGSALEPLGRDAGEGTVRVNSADALRYILWAPGELGFARAFITGAIDVEGEMVPLLRRMQRALPDKIRVGRTAFPAAVRSAWDLGAIGRPLAPPPEEFLARGIRHTLRRDREVVSHHYDVGNSFYQLVLGPALTYSCARFVTPDATLEEAQAAKHELICQKLGLGEATFRAACPGDRPRLLDVGCGWGSMVIHAARHHDVDAVGITVSEEQAALARKRVAEAGMTDCVEIRVQDYRQLPDREAPFDAICSIGMAEHVGHKRMDEYFEILHRRLRDGGRVMNHAIASVGGSVLGRNSFTGRYVFPDGELLDVADTIHSMEAAGFEVRDMENLREHYAETLRRWVANLEERWDEAVRLVGERRARVWRLYMSGSVNGFEDAGLQLCQTLGVKLFPGGRSDMPATRSGWG